MNYELTIEQEEKFNDIVNKMKNKINLALYKCNIPLKQYDEFYSFALEGLLVSFLIMENGDLKKEDFEKFSFVTMKRKIIDELRRRSREKYICLEEIENFKLFQTTDNNIENIIFSNSIENILSNEEFTILKRLQEGEDLKTIFKKLNMSKSKGYNLVTTLKEKCKILLCN